MNILSLVEKGLIPDFLIRRGIRKLLKDRLREENKGGVEAQTAALQAFVESWTSESERNPRAALGV